MPAGLLGLLAAPFGLDGVFWWLMGLGIDWMIAVSQWVANLPGAIGRIAAFGIGPLIAASGGIILMGLLRTRLRWSGAVLLAGSIVWAVGARQPDILISADGRAVAVRGKDQRLHVMRTGKDVFLVKEWLAGDADARSAADASLAGGVSCDEAGCVVETAGGGFVAQAQRPEAVTDDCERATLIVTARAAPGDCRASVIDRARLARQGSLALWRRGNGFAVEAARPRGFDRPWSPLAAGDNEADAPFVSSPAASRSRDATPAEADQEADD
jgi:competence protein ComEC